LALIEIVADRSTSSKKGCRHTKLELATSDSKLIYMHVFQNVTGSRCKPQ
jgi:hypothetical protein